jgi:hypothetical protein
MWWQVIHGAYNKPCVRGTPIMSGDVIRLQHMQTRRWLHSHLHQSPLSGQQEVSACVAHSPPVPSAAPSHIRGFPSNLYASRWCCVPLWFGR